jgi:hypothetical protein
MQQKTINSLYKSHGEKQLFHRYINNDFIEPLLKKLPSIFRVSAIGKSVNQENIYKVSFGNGPKKILMWSQMHGNESTTTKAVFDFFNVISSNTSFSKAILEHCTITVIPILNPDGARLYTRLNANKVDLNRDAQDLSQPESILLRKVFMGFKPGYCFNLHGQRTIFSVGNTNKPATVSFLAPAQDDACTVTRNRKVAIEIIVNMNEHLQDIIPNQVGIYDDAFNINCVGDTFQSYNVPTILFEAGHFKDDYAREQTRKLIFMALLTSLQYIATNKIEGKNYKAYFKIPKNEKLFYDVIIRNASVEVNGNEVLKDIAIQFQERLIDDVVTFIPKVEKFIDLGTYFAHKEIDVNKHGVFTHEKKKLFIGYENDFVLADNTLLSLI